MSTAASLYGFSGGVSPAMAFAPHVDSVTQSINEVPNIASSTTASTYLNQIGFNNPLFWVLVLALIFVGWIGVEFGFDLKRIGGASMHVGGKS